MKIKQSLQKKVLIVEEIINFFKKSVSFVVVEFQKLSVVDFMKLRRMLLVNNSVIKVYKNNLVSLATERIGFKELNDFLKGPNAFVFDMNDRLSSIKILSKFSKTHNVLKLKAGICDGNLLDTNSIKQIALLPSREELINVFALDLLYLLRLFISQIKEIINIKSKLNEN